MGIAARAKRVQTGSSASTSRQQLIMVALHKAPLVIWTDKDHTSGSVGILCTTLIRVQRYCFNTNASVCVSKHQQKTTKSGYTNWTEVAMNTWDWSEGSELWRSAPSALSNVSQLSLILGWDWIRHTPPPFYAPPPYSLNILFLAVSYGTEELMVKSDQPSIEGWRMKWIGGWAQ